MSKLCDRKVRQAEAAAAGRGTFDARQQALAGAAIRSGQVKVEEHGLYSVPSSKNDGSRYASDGISCCCPAGYRRHPRAVLAPAGGNHGRHPARRLTPEPVTEGKLRWPTPTGRTPSAGQSP